MTRPLLIVSFLMAFLAPVISENKLQAQDIITAWHFPNNPDNAIVDISNPLNTTKTVQLVGPDTVNFSYAGVTTQSAAAFGKSAGNGWDKPNSYWFIDINTTGYTDIYLDSRQTSSSTGPREFRIQYSINAGVTWTDVPGGLVNITGVYPSFFGVTGLLLPAACNNLPSVYLRWLNYSNISQSGGVVGFAGTSRIDDIYIQSFSTDYFRSKQNGNWNQTSTWEQSSDNITWVPAYSLPTYRANTITIQSPHNVTVTASITVDQVEINSGGTLTYALNGSTITINDGPGVDLIINGTFHDAGTNSIVWSGSSRWLMGSSGTLIRSKSLTAASGWQNTYNGGIASIPPTSNWINRFTGNGDPAIISSAGYYPNLIFENSTAGTWTPATVGSFFTGSGDFPRILGNLDIGGSGIGSVVFTSDNTHVNLVTVEGNIRIRSGSTLRNNGSGFETKGNLQVDGTLNYGASNTRIIRFVGANPQQITGSGSIGLYELALNKSANTLALNFNIQVDQILRLTAGALNLNTRTLTLSNTTSTIFRTTGYILSESLPASGYGFLSWNINTRLGNFDYPFGNLSGTYIPTVITRSVANDVGFVSIATYPTQPDNTPFPLTVTHVRNNSNLDNSANTVDRFWQINKTVPAGTFNRLYMYYAVAEYASASNLNMDIQRWSPINEGWEPGLPGQLRGILVGNSYVRVDNVSYSGTFAIAANASPLPVSLLNFAAKSVDNTIVLNWVTASEKDNDHFKLLRSFDGKSFYKLASIVGNGNSSSENSYTYTDTDNWRGLAYYRLDQVDFDGGYSIGPIIAVKKQLSKRTDYIYLNTDNSFIWASSDNFDSGILQWIDLTGKIVETLETTADSNQLVIKRPINISGGIYFLKWTGSDQRSIKVLLAD